MPNKQQIIVVLALLLNKKGEILISLRNDEHTPDAHNKWALVGGKLEYGEDPKSALIREVKEETGLEVKNIKLLPKIFTQLWKNKHGREYQVVLIPYKCGIVNEAALNDKLDPKIKELKFVALSEVANYDFLPLDVELISLLTKL